jgi:hypothetical protein
MGRIIEVWYMGAYPGMDACLNGTPLYIEKSDFSKYNIATPRLN